MKQGNLDLMFPMRLIAAVAVMLSFGTARAEPAAPLTTLRAIHAISNDDARKPIPVDFEATVGFSRGYENLLFVQDGDTAIFVRPPNGTQLDPGDRIEVRGRMQASFRPLVIANSITLLHHGAPPKPLPATFDDLIRAGDDSTMVTVHAIVRAADLVASGGTPPVLSARLQLLTEGGHFEANCWIPKSKSPAPPPESSTTKCSRPALCSTSHPSTTSGS
jgi:hypothetical protein